MTNGQGSSREVDGILQKHIDNKDFIKIRRVVTAGQANLSGFILEMSKDFLLIQKEDEFNLNGYAIIKRSHFDSIWWNKTGKAFKKILKSEGILDADFGIKKRINLKSWESIFNDLKRFYQYAVIECERLPHPTFQIGPIKSVNKKFVSIQHFNATGLLDKASTKVKYEDITLVKFDDRYINVFRKYLRSK